MFTNSLAMQTPSRVKALRYSFGIATSKTNIKRASQLAPTVKAFRPGVYRVGSCICDLWRMSCSCKAARSRHQNQNAHPCPHFLALFLAQEWTPGDPDPVKYLKSVGIEQPEIIATYARAHYKTVFYGAPPTPGESETFFVIKIHANVEIQESDHEGYYHARNIKTQDWFYVRKNHISNIAPFYE
jgi:hypothetical protein